MKIPFWLENSFLFIVDCLYACLPQKKPSKEQIEKVKLISHRGVYDKICLENTIAAFDRALELGVWGIEFDIRWTKDLCPVVNHDSDCHRVFSKAAYISQVTFAELREMLPNIPSLEEVVNRYGKKLHLMVELKEENYPDPEKQNAILEKLFAALTPCVDYSFISLHPKIFDYIRFAPTQTFFPIAAISVQALVRLVLENNYGGLLGNYFFIKDDVIHELQSKGKQLGFGFISSKNSLYREVNRGIYWIYTNKPERLLRMIKNF